MPHLWCTVRFFTSWHSVCLLSFHSNFAVVSLCAVVFRVEEGGQMEDQSWPDRGNCMVGPPEYTPEFETAYVMSVPSKLQAHVVVNVELAVQNYSVARTSCVC